MGERCIGRSGVGWHWEGANQPTLERRFPFFPRLKHCFRMIPLLIRFCIFAWGEWRAGRDLFINAFRQLYHDKFCGVPVGGVGSGSIGRDVRGGFRQFHMRPGFKEQQTGNVKADQFIISVRSASSELLYQNVLTAAPQKGKGLSAWRFAFPIENVRYTGLFPRSWTEFEIPALGLTLCCEQSSPVFAHDYQDSCLPVCTFSWSVRNASSTAYDVSIAFTFRNGTGTNKWERESVCRSLFSEESDVTLAQLDHSVDTQPLTYVIGVKHTDNASASSTVFLPQKSGEEIWGDIGRGKLQERALAACQKELAVAVCSTFPCGSQAHATAHFSLVWYQPVTRFGERKRDWKRRYTRFFDGEGAARRIAVHALEKRDEWQQKIEQWQAPILGNETLPQWYRSALFNELYFLSDGSSVWLEWEDEEKTDDLAAKHLKQYGRFGYMESWEYYMFNTYDVHFYASFALLENWPQLELGIQLDFTTTIDRSDASALWSLAEGETSARKTEGRLPHDLGHPTGDPWCSINAYNLHDTGKWKDLNMKYVLLSWRDYERIVRNGNKEEAMSHLRLFFHHSRRIVDRALSEWDRDHDALIENDAFADQTYDVWTMSGPSAYCGSLWLASLYCVQRMARDLGEKAEEKRYEEILARANKAFHEKLWNGRYFQFDAHHPTTIMADQLSGVWFTGTVEDAGLIQDEKVRSALHAIYMNNVKQFAEGNLGACNGFIEGNGVDTVSIQSEEMWPGITYAVASLMLQHDMRSEAFATAEGAHCGPWNRMGLQYQTPEAIFQRYFYRAIGYMRPLSIWSMQTVLNRLP